MIFRKNDKKARSAMLSELIFISLSLYYKYRNLQLRSPETVLVAVGRNLQRLFSADRE